MPRTIVTQNDIEARRVISQDSEISERDEAVGFRESKKRTGRSIEIDAPPQIPDDYGDRLLKYIPVEVVTLYVTLNAVVGNTDQDSPQLIAWVVFFIGLLATPFYLWRAQKVRKPIQLLISTGAFVVWVYALGGPFRPPYNGWHNPLYAAVLLPTYTFFVALIAPKSRNRRN